jgi:5-formaminoimidazole-4-carboxamide-1-beta-D-ribofuranosyl 5'-monophosphate synthetase
VQIIMITGRMKVSHKGYADYFLVPLFGSRKLLASDEVADEEKTHFDSLQEFNYNMLNPFRTLWAQVARTGPRESEVESAVRA